MTDFTDRMRTCAAHLLFCSETEGITAEWKHVCSDAAELLTKAAIEIELLNGPIDLGERINIIEAPVVTPPPAISQTSAVWIGDDLKPIQNTPKSLNACPKCDSRAQKTIRKKGKSLWLVCPVCEHAWTR